MLEAQLTRPHTLCPCWVVVVVLQTSRLGSVVEIKLDVGTGVEVHQSLLGMSSDTQLGTT